MDEALQTSVDGQVTIVDASTGDGTTILAELPSLQPAEQGEYLGGQAPADAAAACQSVDIVTACTIFQTMVFADNAAGVLEILKLMDPP